MKYFIAIMLYFIFWAVTAANGFSSQMKTTNPISEEGTAMYSGNTNIREQVELLESLGISGMNESEIMELENSWDSMPEEVRDSLNMTAMALSTMGRGSYDYQTGIWTPTSNVVYSFDMEIFDISKMFTTFLQGIASINNNDFEITQVTENSNQVNEEQGTGKQTVSFCYNGHQYTFEGNLNNDWFDTNFFTFINQVLSTEKNSKKLFFLSDGYQDCIVFYNTEEWARQFTEKTGCSLYTQ